jgi:chromosome segregation ATPase
MIFLSSSKIKIIALKKSLNSNLKIMKRLSIYALSALIVFQFSCGAKKENEALKLKIEKLEAENSALKSNKTRMESSVKEYKNFLIQINNNLKEIDLSSSMVGKLGGEIKKNPDVKVEIGARINSIKQLIMNSKLKILALDKSLNDLRRNSKEQSEEIHKLDNELKQATRDLMERELAFVELTSNQEELEMLYNEQMAITQELQSILDRAYFYAGEMKELKEKNIVEAEGGFIGIGRVKVLNANSPESIFEKLSKSQSDSVIVAAKKVKMITNHPEGSYKVKSKNEMNTIVILDKKAFWSQGNYLVVQKN